MSTCNVSLRYAFPEIKIRFNEYLFIYFIKICGCDANDSQKNEHNQYTIANNPRRLEGSFSLTYGRNFSENYSMENKRSQVGAENPKQQPLSLNI